MGESVPNRTYKEFIKEDFDSGDPRECDLDQLGVRSGPILLKYRRLGGEIIEPIIPDPLCLGGCGADYNCDGDVDGLDLVAYTENGMGISVEQLAIEYGKADCCETGL